jgi:hypothetical protein
VDKRKRQFPAGGGNRPFFAGALKRGALADPLPHGFAVAPRDPPRLPAGRERCADGPSTGSDKPLAVRSDNLGEGTLVIESPRNRERAGTPRPPSNEKAPSLSYTFP